jgi:hypothetical protein
MKNSYKVGLCFFLLIISIDITKGQNVTITPSGITPASNSTYPRLSHSAILNLTNPVAGDISYDTTFDCLRIFNGIKWVCTYQNPTDKTPNIGLIAAIGGYSYEIGADVAVDPLGNIYITGSFQGNIDFGTVNINSSGNSDVFIAKYDSDGTLQWVKTGGGIGSDNGKSIEIDLVGNIYIVGNFNETATFENITISSKGSSDIFVAKYDTDGLLNWVKSGGGTAFDNGNGIAVDLSGNVYITGSFQGAADFGIGNISSVGSADMFVAKYSVNGNLQWLQSGGGLSFDVGSDITIDSFGDIYVIGSYGSTATFGSASITSLGNSDVFLAKYSSTSTLQWVRSGGGSSDDSGRSIATDMSGNIFIVGFFNNSTTFTSNTVSGSNHSLYLTKYSRNGTVQWVVAENVSTSYLGGGFRLATDIKGNCYVTGSVCNSTAFGSMNLAGICDAFVVKYSDSGNLIWKKAVGGPEYDNGKGIALDSSSGIYIVGSFVDKVLFGVQEIESISSNSSDVFLIKIDN